MIKLISVIVLVFSGAGFLFGFILLYDNIASKLSPAMAHNRFFHKMNRFQGRKILIHFIRTFFVVGLMMWILLVSFFVDPVTLGLLSHFADATIQTPLGIIDKGNEYWFFTACLLGFVGAKASLVMIPALSILLRDNIGVNRFGKWGPVGSSTDYN